MQDQQAPAERTDLAGVITKTLAELGGSADAVADSLRARQIKGTQGDECDCPIARLIREMPGLDSVDVFNGMATLFPAGTDGTVDIDLPEPVSNFVWLFDQGLYLDLVELSAVA
ncbi:hypothetical protein [Actinoplanes regularis]|uniref:hypothetical protein n=1 Tax=Actinoplanes regularis TaxID=52697 RepID=UPI002554A931|nr:hypothetical protein [Actinoplanes regularis]